MRHVERMVKRRVVYGALVRKPEGKRILGKPRRRWRDNIKKNPQKMGWGVLDWEDLVQERGRWRAFVNAAMNILVP